MAEAARIIADSVDPDANIISGMVIDPTLEEAMEVTVIATGFDRHAEDRPRIPAPPISTGRPVAVPAPAPSLASVPLTEREEPEKAPADVPFYRKALRTRFHPFRRVRQA